MDPASNPELWHEFAIMVGGSFAALAGLLVVSVSINVEQILAEPALVRRAGASLVATISPLVASVFILLPKQSPTALGWEFIALALTLLFSLSYLNRPTARSAQQTLAEWTISMGVPTALLIVSFLLTGSGVLAGSLGGLYWLLLAVLAALAGGLLQAWILLIEIRR